MNEIEEPKNRYLNTSPGQPSTPVRENCSAKEKCKNSAEEQNKRTEQKPTGQNPADSVNKRGECMQPTDTKNRIKNSNPTTRPCTNV
ncbi:hypothetical protein L0665_00830 [Methanogenium marinum]|uniref:Uncharacterized protein n=1 Tax=Methanogenium marinum TaxID=348610 RepID=A0A9Q4KR65_9EURY|nr:hypothetical protein [Methanogenium marinum]MDE4907172.1 hypothetical protein [Methanogenium marinum]